jgi:hypothetical protein
LLGLSTGLLGFVQNYVHVLIVIHRFIHRLILLIILFYILEVE